MFSREIAGLRSDSGALGWASMLAALAASIRAATSHEVRFAGIAGDGSGATLQGARRGAGAVAKMCECIRGCWLESRLVRRLEPAERGEGAVGDLGELPVGPGREMPVAAARVERAGIAAAEVPAQRLGDLGNRDARSSQPRGQLGVGQRAAGAKPAQVLFVGDE